MVYPEMLILFTPFDITLCSAIINNYPIRFQCPCEEAFLEECELLRSDLLENDLNVEGEFVTEDVLRDEWGWSEKLDPV